MRFASPSPAFPPSITVCPGCGLTDSRLREGGKMGCARCYRTFALLVADAVQAVQGGEASSSPAVPPPPVELPPARQPLPWPTKRAAPR